MKTPQIQQKIDNLTEALKSLVSDMTDEIAAEYVEDLLMTVAEEAISYHSGLLEAVDLEENEEDTDDFYSDTDDFALGD